MGRYRPDRFRINRRHQLADGLAFAGLGGLGCVGSSTWPDASIASAHGTLTNMDGPSDWVHGDSAGEWALDFDGSNDYVSLPANLSSTSSLTVLARFKPRTISTAIQLLVGNTAQGALGWDLDINRQQGRVSFAHGNAVAGTGSSTLTANTWASAAVVREIISAGNYNWKIYVNGILDGSGSSSVSDVVPATTAIGCRLLTTPDRFFNGTISRVMIWRRALSDGEVAIASCPCDPMLGGLLVPPTERRFANVVGGFNPAWFRPAEVVSC